MSELLTQESEHELMEGLVERPVVEPSPNRTEAVSLVLGVDEGPAR